MDLVLYYRERRNLSCQPYVDRRADADCRKADIRAEATEADRRQAHGSDGTTIVKLLQTDPLPLVSVQINGGPAVTFFIDTGGSTVALDADFAKELGVPQLGTVKGTFAGGQTAEVGLGRIFHQTLQWTVQDLPVGILPLGQLDLGGGYRIDGIIGTTLFYHFLATMDYPNGQLVLRRKNVRRQRRFMQASSDSVVVPFWIAGDHLMVGWGQVEARVMY
jgi:hypothetical protein